MTSLQEPNQQQQPRIQCQDSPASEIMLEDVVESGHGNSHSIDTIRNSNSNHDGSSITRTSHPKRAGLAETEHLGRHRQYWRDMVLGVNDGLVSTFLLIAGVVGGGLSSTNVLLTAIAGGIAGAVSMSSGEYIATKSQNQVLHGEVALEQSHIRKYKKDELYEVSDLLETIGIPATATELRRQLLSHYEADSEALLKIMVALEFGVVAEEERSAGMAALVSGLLFLIGSLPPILPFCVRRMGEEGVEATDQLIGSAVSTCVALLVVGAVKTWATRTSCLVSSLENLLVAGLGGGFAYGVGMLFDSILNDY
jgi:vacuolar iron transporter family protein